jgi:glycosyltransferase involved in cell wall biosynthesis
MFESLMAAIPVIVSNRPEMKKIVDDNSIGVVAKDNTPQGLQEAIEKATELNKNELQVNIQKVKEIYNWEEQENVLLKVYRGLYE